MKRKAMCKCECVCVCADSETCVDQHFIKFPCGHIVEKPGTEQKDLFRRLLEQFRREMEKIQEVFRSQN